MQAKIRTLVQDRNSRELTSAYSVEVLLLLSENQGRHGLMVVTDVQIETEKEQMDTSCWKKTEMRKMSIQKQLAEMKSTSRQELGMN